MSPASALLPLLAALALACSGPQTYEELPPELKELSVISARGAGWQRPAHAAYAFAPGSRVVVDDPRTSLALADEMVRGAIESGLREQGWTLRHEGAADYVVGYVALVDDYSDAHAVSKMLGMDPGLVPDPAGHDYERGTLVILIAPQGSRTPVWRGAAQAYIDFDLPQDVRRERVRRGTEAILQQL